MADPRPATWRVSRRGFLARTGLALGALAAASGLGRAGSADASPVVGLPRRRAGGELTVAVAERALTLDPADHYAISPTFVLRHIFDPLIDVTNDNRFIPALAESWEAVNSTTWRFALRRDVKFHDGTPFNADSVVATLTRVRDNTKLIKSYIFQEIDRIDKDGDYAVTVVTKRPFGSLPSHLTMLGMLPPNMGSNDEEFFARPVGTGPFTFSEWTRGEQVVLKANPNYWQRGIPRVDKVTFRFIPELSTRASGLRAGEFDIIDRVTPDLVQTLRDTSGVKTYDVVSIEAQQWIFQLQKDPVRDVRLRKAISLGIDRDAIVKELLLGYGRTAVCPIPPGLIGFVDLGAKPYDPDRAKALIKEAGYEGVSIDFVLMKDVYPKQLEIAQAVASMLDEVGIKLTIRNLEIAAAREQRTAGTYDMFYSGWAHMPHDPDWYFGQWFTKSGAEKLNRYDNPEVERLIAEARVPDPAQRQQKYEQLQRILWYDEEPTIWPFYSVGIFGTRDRVQNFEARSDYYILVGDVSVT